jgi:hypothetical protein
MSRDSFVLEAAVLRVDGVFRAVKIESPGELDVRFWYRPLRWNVSLGLCGVGVLLLLVSAFASCGNRVIRSSK